MLPASYAPMRGRYDELVDPSGSVRPQWVGLLEAWVGLGPAEIHRRQQVAQRMLVAEHAGHAVQEQPGLVQPSGLDPMPYVIGAAEWARVESGIRQRVEVVEAVLADLHGPRCLLIEGVIPPEAVFGTRAYHLATVGVPVRHHRLISYGADLVRDAAGHLLVLRDHTDAPSGAGWALLNRTMLARLFPDALRSLEVRPLVPWLTELRRALADLVPEAVANPRIVVLGPGQDHKDHIESSYLATQLGYHLADPRDLVVRGQRVWLRALDGLEPVDVVLRRLGDQVSDPLELGPRGSGGVAGLLEVVRSGRVGVANALGSGLADRLWLQPFLDACCRYFNGVGLELAAIETCWLGDPDHRATVLADLGRFVLHDTDPVSPERSVFGAQLDGEAAASWLARVEAAPHRYVAQRTIDFATTPVVVDGRLRAGVGTIRVHAVRTESAVQVMPGGHGRQVAEHRPVIDLVGSSGKDVWVVGDALSGLGAPVVVRPVELPEVDLRDSVPTRAAEALWWLGRNAERAEAAARLCRVVLQRAEQHPELVTTAWIEPVAAGLRALSGGTPPAHGDVIGLLDEVAGAVSERPGGLADSLANLVAAATSVREFLSTSTWQLVNGLSAERGSLAVSAEKSDTFVMVESIDRVLLDLMALAGLASESMVRGPGWRFFDLGRRVERSLLTLGLIESTVIAPVHDEVEQAVHATVLAALESLVAYRRRYRSDLRLGPLAELVVSDADNPRSLAFNLQRIADHLAELPRHDATARQAELVATARASCTSAAVRALHVEGDGGTGVAGGGLVALVVAVRGPVLNLANELATTWFSHPTARDLRG